MKLRFELTTIYLPFFICVVLATISPGNKGKPKKEFKFKTGPQDDDIFQRELVSEVASPRDILVHNGAYFKDTSLKRFNGTVLGYVTAWNSHGYDVAKIFAKKFNIISPDWFQIIKIKDSYVLAGSHDIDASWIKDVRRKGKVERGTVKFFPRVIFEKFTENDFLLLLSNDVEQTKVCDIIISTCKEHGFDGIVLEVWSQLATHVDDHYLIKLVINISHALQREKLRLILVIPPFRAELPNMFSEKHMDKLYKNIYAFSLMTYDYSNVRRPGANSPLYWVKRSIENLAPENCHDKDIKRAKILMGMNLYGNDYTPDGGGPIIAGQYLELLRHFKAQLSLDERDVEHYFEVRTHTGRHYVFYPTLYSINERIKLAREMGVGISLWEIGQGLDYFYDLF